MMRRTGFARTKPATFIPQADRVKPVAVALTRPVRYATPANDPLFVVEKINAIQHAGYMAIVRKLPCARCGIGHSIQFAHADKGKGMGIKTDCRRGWPGCGPHDDTMGCHHLVGTSGTLKQAERRAVELTYAIETRAKVLALGLWPASLPRWDEAA